MVPSDPFILLSWVNTQLRDRGLSLPDLCREEGVDQDALISRLEAIGYRYDPDHDRFC